MKRFLAFLLLAASALAVQFAWDDPDNPPEKIRGYRIYDEQGGNASLLAEVTNRTYSATLSPGSHTIYVTAVSNEGIDGPLSNPVPVWVPAAVKNVAVVITGN